MSFSFRYTDKLDILYNGAPIFEGVTLSAKINAEADTRYSLAYIGSCETHADFEDAHGFNATLCIEEKYGAMVLSCKASYVSGVLDFKYGAHFHPEEAICINFAKITDAAAFAANWLRCEFWCRTKRKDTGSSLEE